MTRKVERRHDRQWPDGTTVMAARKAAKDAHVALERRELGLRGATRYQKLNKALEEAARAPRSGGSRTRRKENASQGLRALTVEQLTYLQAEIGSVVAAIARGEVKVVTRRSERATESPTGTPSPWPEKEPKRIAAARNRAERVSQILQRGTISPGQAQTYLKLYEDMIAALRVRTTEKKTHSSSNGGTTQVRQTPGVRGTAQALAALRLNDLRDMEAELRPLIEAIKTGAIRIAAKGGAKAKGDAKAKGYDAAIDEASSTTASSNSRAPTSGSSRPSSEGTASTAPSSAADDLFRRVCAMLESPSPNSGLRDEDEISHAARGSER